MQTAIAGTAKMAGIRREIINAAKTTKTRTIKNAVIKNKERLFDCGYHFRAKLTINH